MQMLVPCRIDAPIRWEVVRGLKRRSRKGYQGNVLAGI